MKKIKKGDQIQCTTNRFSMFNKGEVYTAMNEISVRAQYFMVLADDAYHKRNNQLASHYLLVAERFFNELKIRVITTSN